MATLHLAISLSRACDDIRDDLRVGIVSTRLFTFGFATSKAGEARFFVENLLILFVIILLSLILVSVFPISEDCLEQIGAEFSSCASDNFDLLSVGTSQVALMCFPFLEIPVFSVC